jgi:hypothetical protein
MNENKNSTENGWQTQGESLNTGSASTESTPDRSNTGGEHQKENIHNNALYAASMGRPATAQVDPHSNSGLAQTGTNTSYEGPTAPGAGGSSGSGYTSGQSGVQSSISTDSDYEQAGIGRSNEESGDDEDEAKNTLI